MFPNYYNYENNYYALLVFQTKCMAHPINYINFASFIYNPQCYDEMFFWPYWHFNCFRGISFCHRGLLFPFNANKVHQIWAKNSISPVMCYSNTWVKYRFRLLYIGLYYYGRLEYIHLFCICVMSMIGNIHRLLRLNAVTNTLQLAHLFAHRSCYQWEQQILVFLIKI